MGVNNKGFALVLTIIILNLVVIFTSALTLKARLNYELINNMCKSRQALYTAEGGIELIRYILFIKEGGESLYDVAREVLEHYQLLYRIDEMKNEISVQLNTVSTFSVHIHEGIEIIVTSKGYYGEGEYRLIQAAFDDVGNLLSWQELRED